MEANVPKYLYRYTKVDEYLKRLILNSEVSFSSKDNFNDPFDCKIHFAYDKAKERDPEYFRECCKLSDPPFSSEQVESLMREAFAHERPIEPIVNLYQKMHRDDTRSHGICSFSEDPQSLLLWAHYGYFHRGVCVRFAMEKADFVPSLYKVTYTDEAFAIDILAPEESIGEKYVAALSTKSSVWKYEKEWRIILPGFIPKDDLYAGGKLENPCIDRIILGCRISDSHKKDIQEWARTSNIQVVQAEEVEGTFAIRIPD